MPTATMTSKGQVTIPKEVRDHLHLAEGDRLEFFIATNGEVQVRPVAGSVEALFGMLRRPGASARSVEEMDAEMARWLAAEDRRIRRGD